MTLRLNLLSLFLFFLLGASVLNAQTKDIRLIFFSDDYTSTSVLQNTFEQNLAKQKEDYTLEKAEKLPAFFSGKSYILSSEKTKAFNSYAEEFLYRTIGSKDVISTDSALLFQQPYLDGAVKNTIIPENTEKDSRAPQVIRMKNGLLTLPDGGSLETLSPYSSVLKRGGLWLPAVMLKYTLSKNEEKTFVYILQKPLGGIGAWFNPVQNLARTADSPLLIINTGGLEKYERLASQPAFLARYWQSMDTDAVAFAPKDAFIIYKGALAYPELKEKLLASNIAPVEEDGEIPFSQTALIEKNGVKIGLISLSEQNALDGAPSRGLPLKTTSPFEAAAVLSKDLRENQNADFIILVSHLRQKTLNAVLEETKGIDMVIDAEPQEKGQFLKKRIELKDWNLKPAAKPAFLAEIKPDTLGDVNIEFTLNENGFSPCLIEDNPPLNIFTDNNFNNEFYPVNKYFFDDGQSSDEEYLLPNAKDLAVYSNKNALSYTPAEFFNLAASVIRKTLKTETAFIRISPFKEKQLGTISQNDLAAMLGADEPIVKVKIKGKHLKKLLKVSVFDQPFSDEKDYSDGFSLAVSGAEKDGGTYKINALSVNDDEIYSAAFPESLLKEIIVLPGLNSDLIQSKQSGFTTQQLLGDYLSKLLAKNKNEAEKQAEKYRKERERRLAQGLPPQDETTEELDLLISLQGPAAADEYFSSLALKNYEKQIFKLIENTPERHGAWRYNLRNLSFRFSSTDVKNAEKYKNFSDSRLTSDDQTLLQGALNFAAEYYKENIRWDNILSLKYGQTALRSYDGAKSTSENADHISLSTDYTYKSTDVKNFLGGFLIGPFVSVAYQTEFTRPEDAPRYKALRGRAGIRLFEGKYLKDFSVSLSPELDFTYPQTATKYAWQAIIKAEHPLNENAKAVYGASVRDFFLVQNPSDTDISYEFELSARVEMEVWKAFYIAPFISYYQAQARDFSGAGCNIYAGVSLSYSKLFKPIKI